MRNKKLILSLASISGFAIAPVLFAVSCVNDENSSSDSTKDPDKKKDQDTTKPGQGSSTPGTGAPSTSTKMNIPTSFDDLFTLKLGEGEEKNRTKRDFTPQTIEKRYQEIVDLVLKDKYKNQFSTLLISAKAKDGQNGSGIVDFIVQFTNKTDPTDKVIRTYSLGDFNTNNGIDDDGTIRNNRNTVDDFDAYDKASQLERWKIDNDKYYKELQQQYQFSGATVETARPELNYSSQRAQAFNEKAKLAHVPDYESSILKGFTLPKLGENGTFEGLSIHPHSVPTNYSAVDFLGNRNPYQSIGVARILPNERYKQISLETIAVDFTWDERYEKEIKEAQDAIKKLKEWKDSSVAEQRLKEYKDASIDIQRRLIKQYEYERDLEVERDFEADKESTRRRWQTKIDGVNEKIKEIEAYTYDNVIKLYEDEIKGYETQIKAGNMFRGSGGTM
ncbi:hypothetical protein [Mycoplasma simbae]|uniref:hypothetical protein n=1 Tax=Mycoplasma simbae TaxID=36744 RepID=UPI00068E6AEE|nr:hypothetical protein [Mycoplasma simbae]